MHVAINALDFKSEIPFVFDEWCHKYDVPVIHPYNIGWGGLVTNIMFWIATGQEVKRYPKFYLSSIIDDRN